MQYLEKLFVFFSQTVLLSGLFYVGNLHAEILNPHNKPAHEIVSITGSPYFDLLKLYNLALEEDTDIRAAAAERESIRQIMVQKQSVLLPSIQASASQFQNTTTDPALISSYMGKGLSLTLSQPLINVSYWAEANYGRKLNIQAKIKYLSAQQNLILRVAEAYFSLLKAMDSHEAALSEHTAMNRHLEEARQRYKAGLIAITDVEIAKARRDNAIATEIQAKNTLENQQEALQQIVNHPVEHIYRLDDTLELRPPTPNDKTEWVMRALSDNFDLQIARLNASLAREQIKSSVAQHLPTLSLGATVSKTTQLSPTQPVVVERPRTSNVNLTLNIPIFSGFGTQAKAKEHKLLYQKSFFELESQHRRTELLTNQHYRGVLTYMSRAKALKQAALSNEVALKATNVAFEAGTRTIVDVLEAQSALIAARQAHLAARYDYLLEGLYLKSMAGILDTRDLLAINALLVTEKKP